MTSNNNYASCAEATQRSVQCFIPTYLFDAFKQASYNKAPTVRAAIIYLIEKELAEDEPFAGIQNSIQANRG